MAYADQTMSTRKAVSIGLVVALHAALGYAFITGLAYNVIKKAAQDLKVVDIQEAPPPPEQKPPPPPPEQKFEPPPIVAPPPVVQTPTIAPPIVSVPTPPPVVITPAAPPAPPPPPAPVVSKAAGAKGDPAQWVTSDDYPPSALREEREGVTKVTWQINEQGRIENCSVVSSSGSPDLDETACRVLTRRGRYSPALDQSGKPMRTTQSRTIRWQIPKN
ncbi:energy transducer TonB [Sphingomonas sp. AP4-R1]|uniref:energy transducer TonB n=1 Tax=Sphingomonas sp. AP4-R1 TaxID=2735134 RepID=UPI00149371B3|nr:energy transducer TonB [Sphingomonas sp. AP4-R1]QJU60577.1 energy transducer TonB [Sphingomonas sp. AP4-R1]